MFKSPEISHNGICSCESRRGVPPPPFFIMILSYPPPRNSLPACPANLRENSSGKALCLIPYFTARAPPQSSCLLQISNPHFLRSVAATTWRPTPCNPENRPLRHLKFDVINLGDPLQNFATLPFSPIFVVGTPEVSAKRVADTQKTRCKNSLETRYEAVALCGNPGNSLR